MSTLLLRLAAPMQSWGRASKFDRRLTEQEPTRSGVLGLLACAMGLRRESSLSVFDSLRFGVRIDQVGRLGVDYQIVQDMTKKKNANPWVTHRYYLLDAVFLAAVEGEQDFLVRFQHALLHPAFPLFLGRRSCPPVGPLVLGIRDKSLDETLRTEPWRAGEWYQKRMRKKQENMQIEIVRDAGDTEPGYSVRDVPISFSQRKREYGFRNVIRENIPLQDIWRDDKLTVTTEKARTEHDPMELLEEDNVSVKS
jgi:CRISPR system Cascade subunit CasD